MWIESMRSENESSNFGEGKLINRNYQHLLSKKSKMKLLAYH